MSFTFYIPHPGPGGDTTVNMTVGNTTCKQLSDDVFKLEVSNSHRCDARFGIDL
jgi:hypothetical protein